MRESSSRASPLQDIFSASAAARRGGGQVTKRLCIGVVLLSVLFVPAQARAASGSWFAQGSGTVVNTSDFPTPVVERWQWVATSGVGTDLFGAPAKGHFSERIPGTDISFDA